MSRTSVIIVAFNNKELLDESLRSLANQTYRDFEIILVDNNSTDGTYDFIKTNFPETLCIRSVENLGFAGGNNLGLKHAGGEYIALLNSDAVAQPTWLKNLVAAMDKHPDVGICASKMIASRTDSLDSAGDGFSANLKGYKRGEGMPSSSFDKEEYIFGACAGASGDRPSRVLRPGMAAYHLPSHDRRFFRRTICGQRASSYAQQGG